MLKIYPKGLVAALISLGLVFAVMTSSAATVKGKKPMNTTETKVDARSETKTDAQVNLPLFYKGLVPLSKSEHANLEFPEMHGSYAFARETNIIPILLSEVGRAEANYPIVFIQPTEKDPISMAVLVGLNGKNHYLDQKDQWVKDAYIPAWVRRYPFFAVQVDGKSDAMIAIDPNYQFIKDKGGKPFFDKDGKGTERLQSLINSNLAYQKEAVVTQAATEALKEAGVLEGGTLQLRAGAQGDTKSFTGFLIVNEKKLMGLEDAQIVKLQRSGALGMAYAQMLSMRNIKFIAN